MLRPITAMALLLFVACASPPETVAPQLSLPEPASHDDAWFPGRAEAFSPAPFAYTEPAPPISFGHRDEGGCSTTEIDPIDVPTVASLKESPPSIYSGWAAAEHESGPVVNLELSDPERSSVEFPQFRTVCICY